MNFVFQWVFKIRTLFFDEFPRVLRTLSFYKLFLYIGDFWVSLCIGDFEFLRTFLRHWLLWILTNFPLVLHTLNFYEFLMYWRLWVFTISFLVLDLFFNEFPPVLGTLSFDGFSLVPEIWVFTNLLHVLETLRFDEFPPCTGDFEFYNLPHAL